MITAESFYKTKAWRIKRKYILKRDKYFCQDCLKYGKRVDANTVHHIKSIEAYPELRLVNSNLKSLCSGCHNKYHPEKGGSYGRRRDF